MDAWPTTLSLMALFALAPADAQSTEYELDPEAGWVQTQAPEPGSDEALIAKARAYLADDRPGQAAAILTPWLERNASTNNPWVSAALLARGDARVALGEEFKALYDYEAIARQFAQSEEFPLSVEREMDIARLYLGGMRKKLFGLRLFSARDEGIELLIRAQERMPGSALAEQAAIELADYYFDHRDMPMARIGYDLYLLNFPGGSNQSKAFAGRIFANIGLYHGPEYDASSLLNAREQISGFERAYPADAQRLEMQEWSEQIKEALGAEKLEAALWYLDRGDGPSARLTLRRLVRQHPTTQAAARAIDILTQNGWLAADSADLPATPETAAAQPVSEADTDADSTSEAVEQ